MSHKLRVLVACEFSGVVRDAFLALGHDAMSCDLLPTEAPGPHHQGDVRDVLGNGWDLMVCHPPCDHLSLSGARWCTDHWVKNKKGNWWHDGTEKRRLREEAVAFAKMLFAADIPRIAMENPMSILSTRIRKPDQRINPFEHGHGERKETWLWLKNLPKLVPTDEVPGRETRIFNMTPSPNRKKERSLTFPGIARAMATQWGGVASIERVA